jgi:RNA polymerase sigma-70 factor (ECF subfamily)
MRNDSPANNELDTARLYREYAPAVSRWAGRLARSASDAEDILQEVFLVVARRRASLPLLHNPGAWLYGITTNVARRRWRDRSRHALADQPGLDALVDESPSPFDDLAQRRLMESLDRALGRLQAWDRRLLWLCDVRHMPTSRISAITGIKQQTLRVRRFRARRQIARWMCDPENIPNPVGVEDCRKSATCSAPIARMARSS